jgi:hypothetical protein
MPTNLAESRVLLQLQIEVFGQRRSLSCGSLAILANSCGVSRMGTIPSRGKRAWAGSSRAAMPRGTVAQPNVAFAPGQNRPCRSATSYAGTPERAVLATSGPIPKFASFVRHPRLRTSESRTTSNFIILVSPFEPEVRGRTGGRMCANFGFGALGGSQSWQSPTRSVVTRNMAASAQHAWRLSCSRS